jgi:hypothetical protein
MQKVLAEPGSLRKGGGGLLAEGLALGRLERKERPR